LFEDYFVLSILLGFKNRFLWSFYVELYTYELIALKYFFSDINWGEILEFIGILYLSVGVRAIFTLFCGELFFWMWFSGEKINFEWIFVLKL
jgi:hypothetical protein